MNCCGSIVVARLAALRTVALLMLGALNLASPSCLALAAEIPSASTGIVAEPVATVGEGPERLKKQVWITMETNAAAVASTTTNAAVKPKTFNLKYNWKSWDGLHLELSQKTPIKDPFAGLRERLEGTNAYRVFSLEELKMSGKIGAKFAVDAATYVTGKEFDDFDPGVELRRARIYGKGDCLLILPVSYELEIGYIPNQFYLENSYLKFKDVPWIGELKGGQFQPPMSLDLITSSRDISFMEPAAPIQALAPGTSAGIQIGHAVLNQRATWTAGVFTDGVGKDYGDASKDYGRAIMRITALPVWEASPDSTPKVLHLGLSANVLYSGSSSVRYRSRPESHLAPYVIDTGTIAADSAFSVGGEVAWINGPFSIQCEYLHSWVSENGGQSPPDW